MNLIKICLWSLICIVGQAMFPVAKAQTIISDTTFNDSDWSVIVNSDGGASQTNMQQPNGGNPGPFRFMQHILPSPPSPTAVGLIEVAHIYEAESYDPATLGAIDHIDYAEDTGLLNLPYTGAFVRSFALVEQNGMTYRSAAVLIVMGATGWVSGSLPGLKASDFIALDGSGRKPDFSESGAPLKFGFWRNHSRVGDTPVPFNQGLTIDHGIDNFSVTIYPAAAVMCTLEPASSTGRPGNPHFITATVTVDGLPAAGISVTFDITSGPNAGPLGTAPTDTSGQLLISYANTGGPGVDVIEASGTAAGQSFSCLARHTWIANRAPTARDDLAVVDYTGGTISVLDNDNDSDGDPLEIASVTQPSSGMTTNTGTSIDYTPATLTAESFSYAVADKPPSSQEVLLDTATVTVLVDCGCTIECLTRNSSSLASRSVYQDSVDLDLLRRFRDEVLQPTEVGSSYVDIYYKRTPEIAKILILDRPDIGAQAVRMVELMQPALRSLLDGDGTEVFTQTMIDSVGAFFDSLSAAGSDSLQQLISDELTRVGPLDNFVGLPVREVLSAVLEDSLATAIEEVSDRVPTAFVLKQNFPNPFNPSTKISYILHTATEVKLTIYNIQGQLIRTLVNAFQSAGEKSITWNGLDDRGTQVPSGLYFFQINTGKFKQTKKMILMR